MLTSEGAKLLAPAVAQALAGAELVVAGHGQEASKPVETIAVDGTEVVLTATFGDDEANFDWLIRRVRVGGELVDEEEVDLGRKASGEWTLEAAIELAPDA